MASGIPSASQSHPGPVTFTQSIHLTEWKHYRRSSPQVRDFFVIHSHFPPWWCDPDSTIVLLSHTQRRVDRPDPRTCLPARKPALFAARRSPPLDAFRTCWTPSTAER
jgi:hypothetical protein